MKKIFVNGKFFCQRMTGTQRYARELLNQIDAQLAEPDYRELSFEILVPKCAREIPDYKHITVRRVGSLVGTKWEQLELPWFCRGKMLLTLSGSAPVLHNRNIITLHDAAVYAAPLGYSNAYRLWHRTVDRWGARTATHIFTVSRFSKMEIQKWFGAKTGDITVTYPGSDHFLRVVADPTILSRHGIEGKYVLAASSANPNKNFGRIVKAMGRPEMAGMRLVVAGGQDAAVYRNSEVMPHLVTAVGHVTDAELKALYENAECFVFASLYEGFGLPPLEAMLCGCPVVVSRCASLPEVFDGGATFCEADNESDIASAILVTVESPRLSASELKKFAVKFSWQACARESLNKLLLLSQD